MSDTQWPLWDVFKQDKPGKPHESIGTVHAPDAEMALLNARDVYVRRPSAVSLWVCPQTAVFSQTAAELSQIQEWPPVPLDAPEEPYLIFTKTSQRRSMAFVRHVGEVMGVTAVHALQKAIEGGQFGGDEVYVWWVIPARAITNSEEDDVPSLFDPALDKKYRQQAYYGFVSPTRKKRGKDKQ